MRKFLAVVAAVWVSIDSVAAEPEPLPKEKRAVVLEAVAKNVAAAKKMRAPKTAKANLEAALRAAEAGVVDRHVQAVIVHPRTGVLTFPSAEAKSRHLDGLKSQIAAVEFVLGGPLDDPGAFAPDLDLAGGFGAAGRMPGGGAVVLKVIDANTATVRIGTKTVSLHNYPTAGFADNSFTKLPGLFYVDGSEKAGAAGGAAGVTGQRRHPAQTDGGRGGGDHGETRRAAAEEIETIARKSPGPHPLSRGAAALGGLPGGRASDDADGVAAFEAMNKWYS